MGDIKIDVDSIPAPRPPTADPMHYDTIGDECFTNGDVISYRGENYYRACDYFVSQRADGSQTFCVRRVGHHGRQHENYDGLVVEAPES